MKRTRLVQGLTGWSSIDAARLLVQIKKDPGAIRAIDYNNHTINLRGMDLNALFEVLSSREYDFASECVTSNDRPSILDVGSHIGGFAVWALSLNPSARVISVEADPATHAVTELNVRAWASQGADWRSINRAAHASDGAMVRFSDSGPTLGHRLDPNGKVNVQTISLPTLVDMAAPDGGCIDLLKIDIEGAEEAFICDNDPSFARVNAVVVELHSRHCDTNRVKAYLDRCFDDILIVSARTSGKPLLYGRGQRL
jgi:FkbM family methyltransferase